MNNRTRVFLLGASAILIIGLGTAGVASYVGLDRIGIGSSGSLPELSYVPAEAQLVAYVDVRHVMDSELRHKLQPDLGSSPQSSKLIEETGINIETDVDSVVLASFASGAAVKGQPPFVLARGRFNPSQIEASLRSHGATAADYQGIRLLTTADEDMAVAFLTSDLVAAGSPSALRLAVDTKAGGRNITDNADVMRLVHKVEDAETWTVAAFDALQSQAQLPPNLATQLPSITWFAAGGHIDSGISGIIHAETRDEKAAQDLREVIRGFMALVRMQVGQQPEFADLVNSVELSGEGTTVSLGFSVPAQIIDRLGTLHAQPRIPAASRPLRPSRPTPARVAVNPSI